MREITGWSFISPMTWTEKPVFAGEEENEA